MKSLFITGLILSVMATSSWAQDRKYISHTFKQSVWSSSSYVGDLKKWVYFGKGYANVVEYRDPESSFDFIAAIRTDDNGDTELESVAGSFRIKDTYIKLETGGANGQLHNPDPFEPLILPTDKTFRSSLNILAVGWDSVRYSGVKYGWALANLIQPAQIDLTYYKIMASAESGLSPTWATSAVDAEYSNILIGFWFEIDSLTAAMQKQNTVLSSIDFSGSTAQGFALDVELIAGLYMGEEGSDVGSLMQDAYGLTYSTAPNEGVGWYLSYKWSYNYVQQFLNQYSLGVQVGVEGRVFQTLLQFAYDKEIRAKNQVIGEMGIGDNTSLQWGPYVRFALEF